MSDTPEYPTLDPREEAFIQEEIERALAPYRAIAPPSLLASMRRTLDHELRTNPVPVQLRKHLFARQDAGQSGEEPKDPSAVKKDEDGHE